MLCDKSLTCVRNGKLNAKLNLTNRYYYSIMMLIDG